MNKTTIEWCDNTVNLVGRNFKKFDEPEFRPEQLDKLKIKTPKNIFIGSMYDLFEDRVPHEWIIEIFKACEANPQHRYLFLTKNPYQYLEMKAKIYCPEKIICTSVQR